MDFGRGRPRSVGKRKRLNVVQYIVDSRALFRPRTRAEYAVARVTLSASQGLAIAAFVLVAVAMGVLVWRLLDLF